MPAYDRIYLNGAWTPSHNPARLTVVDPATEQPLARVPAGTARDADAAVTAARAAFGPWSRTGVAERAGYLRAIAAELTRRAGDLAQLITQDVGCPIAFSRAVQVTLPVNSFLQAAQTALTHPFEQRQGPSLVVREPYGVVAAITPWNFPLHQVAAKVAYALAGGNTVVLKPSELAPLSVWHLTDIIDFVGLPPGVFNLVSGTGPDVGEALAAHPEVDVVSFTGSTRAGRRVASMAAETIKKVTLELGGKSPAVMLPDADPARVVPAVMAASFLNNGQTCSALTRLIVPRSVLAETEELARHCAREWVPADPGHEQTRLGPLISSAQRHQVRTHIRNALASGAKLVTGGEAPPPEPSRGFFVRPTILSRVTSDMAIHHQEVFGPVLAIETYETQAEAVRIANNTNYGLAAAVWSADEDRALAVARELRAGQIQVNGSAFDPNAPFGGYKQSGNGREGGRAGLEELLETKAIQL
ncbi:aldehyde dehydrogenase family protein [Streptomyces sp. ISL-22]|uniref:aldehyde dehydrogenase family protein n=1 Tax=unclassified Streptomyces TaxID=2593676 RepID=UPI001BED3091|nr:MULTISPECIES: aldehyde dehydrogenase family protein [unclassified Streptomyces]MBT2418862.1 aldehyde dehydrogenase family protein [Streptomyces sp. ISL-24]MBT2435705.1 aldehyde dehydrogenase family protein [Streptomyces sp. ISL-22]